MAEDFSFFLSSEKQQPGGRPLAELIKLAGYLIWGNDPGSFHLLVVALHTLAAILLAILLWHQGMALRTSLVGGLLFLVNVAHFRAVHWIAAIEFPLALSCGLGALICYQHFLEDRRSRWLWGFYGGLVLSIAALSAMAFLWPFCLYWSWAREHDIRASLRPLLPLLPVVVLELVVIAALTPRENSTWRAIDQFLEGDPSSLFLGTGRLLLWLLSRLLTTAHWRPVSLYELEHWEFYAGAGVLAGLGVLVYWSRLPVSVWSVWILLSILPFLPLNDAWIIGRPEGPSRHLYPATAGASLLLAWGLEEGESAAPVLGAVPVWCPSGQHPAQQLPLSQRGRSCFPLFRGPELHRSWRLRKQGVEQLKRAIEQGRDAIDLEDAYERICYMGMGKEGEEERSVRRPWPPFPSNPKLNYLRTGSRLAEAGLGSRESQALEQLEALQERKEATGVDSSVHQGEADRLSRNGEIIRGGQAWRLRPSTTIRGIEPGDGTGNPGRISTGPSSPIAAPWSSIRIACRDCREPSSRRCWLHAGREEEAVRGGSAQAVERSSAAPGGLLITASFGLLASRQSRRKRSPSATGP